MEMIKGQIRLNDFEDEQMFTPLNEKLDQIADKNKLI